jgi:hypothetical protein
MRRRFVFFVTMLVSAALLLAACATPAAREVTPVAKAHLVVTNLTAYTWRVVVSRRETLVQTTEVGKFAVVDVSFDAGDYTIEQTLLGRDAANATRHFPLRVEAGRSYRWSLATLLSVDAAASTSGARSTETTTHE